jgi:hypothetical protein
MCKEHMVQELLLSAYGEQEYKLDFLAQMSHAQTRLSSSGLSKIRVCGSKDTASPLTTSWYRRETCLLLGSSA